MLGQPLHQATVTDASILGGQTMRATLADWSALGTGERPWTTRTDRAIDELDVADLESEDLHAYELLDAREGEQVVHEGTSPSGKAIVDGGRSHRRVERFVALLRPGNPYKAIVRLDGTPGCSVHVWADGKPVASFDATANRDASDVTANHDWVERSFEIPASAVAPRTPVVLSVERGELTVFHYWFFAEPPRP